MGPKGRARILLDQKEDDHGRTRGCSEPPRSAVRPGNVMPQESSALEGSFGSHLLYLRYLPSGIQFRA